MIENKTIENVDFSKDQLNEGYCGCLFKGCNFSGATVRDTEFDDCEFDTCDFSLCKLTGVFRDVRFKDCKMIGVDFVELNRFSSGFSFEGIVLNYANFATTKLPKTIFRNCTIHETYFDNADLSSSLFDRCDLTRTSFLGANLEKVDFSTAFNFSINPALCKIKNAVFSEAELKGLLDHLSIVIKPIGE